MKRIMKLRTVYFYSIKKQFSHGMFEPSVIADARTLEYYIGISASNYRN